MIQQDKAPITTPSHWRACMGLVCCCKVYRRHRLLRCSISVRRRAPSQYPPSPPRASSQPPSLSPYVAVMLHRRHGMLRWSFDGAAASRCCDGAPPLGGRGISVADNNTTMAAILLWLKTASCCALEAAAAARRLWGK